MKRIVLILLAVLLLAPAASAKGFFVGGGVSEGSVRFEVDDDTLLDDDDTGIKIFGGYRFSKFFSLEAAVNGFEPSDTLVDIDVFLMEVVAEGTWSVGERFELYAKAGGYKWDVEVDDSDASGSDDDVDITYGAGVRFKLFKRTALRLEYQWYNLDPDDSDLDVDLGVATLGAEFRFGGHDD